MKEKEENEERKKENEEGEEGEAGEEGGEGVVLSVSVLHTVHTMSMVHTVTPPAEVTDDASCLLIGWMLMSADLPTIINQVSLPEQQVLSQAPPQGL